jgi:hypothetical protein
MLLLTSTSDLISLVTSSTATIDVHASYVDNASGTITPGRTNTATISSASTTTIVGSPAASTQRNVKTIIICNRSASTSCVVTVKLTDGTNNNQLVSTTLQIGEELIYLEGNQGFTQLTASGAVKTAFDPTNVSFTGGTMSGVGITTKAGTTAAAGLTMASGTLATSALAGMIEYDGVVAYATPVASERGVIDEEQFITMQGGTFTLTSQTAAQKLFNSPTNGSVTVGGSRSYLFECEFDLSTMSSTSGSFGFALAGTATFTYLKWWSYGVKAALATAVATQSTMNANSTSNTTLVTATTNTVGWAHIHGILRVNAGGTIIPQVSLGIAAAAVVGRDSYFRLWPLGTNVVTSVGNWS